MKIPLSENRDKKVLIVDDEPDMRIFLSTLLQTVGFKPYEACNCKEGLEKCQSIDPDLIIMEIMTKGDEGLDLYCALRKDSRLQKIPIIILSSLDKKTFIYYQNLRKLQPDRSLIEPDAYLKKPPETEELLRWAYILSETERRTGNVMTTGEQHYHD
jgi:two-component system, OmpR family, phosphate regulon response regulator PhoB